MALLGTSLVTTITLLCYYCDDCYYFYYNFKIILCMDILSLLANHCNCVWHLAMLLKYALIYESVILPTIINIGVKRELDFMKNSIAWKADGVVCDAHKNSRMHTHSDKKLKFIRWNDSKCSIFIECCNVGSMILVMIFASTSRAKMILLFNCFFAPRLLYMNFHKSIRNVNAKN